MDDKKVKITIICFVAGLIFGTFLIISGYKKPLTNDQIEKCKLYYTWNKETYSYNKCYKLLKMNRDVFESVFK